MSRPFVVEIWWNDEPKLGCSRYYSSMSKALPYILRASRTVQEAEIAVWDAETREILGMFGELKNGAYWIKADCPLFGKQTIELLSAVYTERRNEPWEVKRREQ